MAQVLKTEIIKSAGKLLKLQKFITSEAIQAQKDKHGM